MGVNLSAGVRLGDFKILRLLGAGGEGTVYQARQVSLDREVALKILGQSLRGGNDKLRFKRQAQAVARLRHPNITEVYCVSQDEDYCYMAMRHVEGCTLRQVLDRVVSSQVPISSFDALIRTESMPSDGMLEIRYDIDSDAGDDPLLLEGERPEPEVITPQAWQFLESEEYLRRCCTIVEEAALALDYAHRQDVIHRDIKPENIMLDRDGVVHLIDFGLARLLDDISLSSRGTLVGTLGYMSPEQIVGRVNIDRRSDLYSLGIVLYELLTAGRPFTGPTREAVLGQIATKAVPPVAVRNQAVPRGLEGIVHKAIARDPQERYQTAAEFAHDIRNFIDGRPVEARPYLYRFDHRNIAAERPFRITLIALANFTISLLCFMTTPAGFESFDSQDSLINPKYGALGLGVTCLLSCSIGVGMLYARKPAVVTGIIVNVFVIIFMSMMIIYNYPRRELFGYSVFILCIDVVVINIVSIFLAISKKSRSWYRYANTLYAEHQENVREPRSRRSRAYPIFVDHRPDCGSRPPAPGEDRSIASS